MSLQGQRLWGGRGEPPPGSGPQSVQFFFLEGGRYRLPICPISTSQTHSNTSVWPSQLENEKVLRGKQTTLIHIAVWRPRWTHMSENIDQVARSFIFSFRLLMQGQRGGGWGLGWLLVVVPQAKWNNGFSKSNHFVDYCITFCFPFFFFFSSLSLPREMAKTGEVCTSAANKVRLGSCKRTQKYATEEPFSRPLSIPTICLASNFHWRV